MVFTTNNENALAVATDARRFVLLRCSEKYLDNEAHFVELGEYLARPDVIRAFYQFAMKRNLSIYRAAGSFQHRRPVTEFYCEAQKKSISTTNNFLSAIVNTEGSKETYMAKELYDLYCSFCRECGQAAYVKSMTTFGSDVKHVGGISVLRTQNGMKYAVDKEAVSKHLVAAREFNDEAYLTRISCPPQF